MISVSVQPQVCRYEIYIQVLEAWKGVKKTDNTMLSTGDLNFFDKTLCEDTVGEEEEEEGGLKKSHSSPSLDLELAPPAVIKVRRNISERRTYRKTIVPRWKKEVWDEKSSSSLQLLSICSEKLLRNFSCYFYLVHFFFLLQI